MNQYVSIEEVLRIIRGELQFSRHREVDAALGRVGTKIMNLKSMKGVQG
jgi:hypothetical protein